MVCVFLPLSTQGETHFAVSTYSLHDLANQKQKKNRISSFLFSIDPASLFKLVLFHNFHFWFGGFVFLTSMRYAFGTGAQKCDRNDLQIVVT